MSDHTTTSSQPGNQLAELPLYRLLDEQPLYRYRTADSKTLQLLFVGGSEALQTALTHYLSNGQLLDCALQVTVATPSPEPLLNRLQQKAPFLPQLVSVRFEGNLLNAPEPDLDTNTALEYLPLEPTPDAVRALLTQNPDCRYLYIGTDGEDESRNALLAAACADIMAARQGLVVYEADEAPTVQQPGVYPLLLQDNRGFHDHLERIAFNTHYIYAKQQNPAITTAEAERDFREPYNYRSSLASALHLKNRLGCCGIELGDDLRDAAHQLRLVLEQRPNLSEQLAALEHRRWCMEKALNGFVQLPEAQMSRLFYSVKGVGTNDSKQRTGTEHKWHCCLVKYDPENPHTLLPDDWKPGADRSRLDPLDRMSLTVHDICGQIARQRQPQVEHALAGLQTQLTDKAQQDLMARLEFAVQQLYKGERSANSSYKRLAAALRQAVDTDLHGLLEELDLALQPQLEYVTFKDYKELDRQISEQMLYLLTHRCAPKLAKLLSEQPLANLQSMLSLEPGEVQFVLYAEREDDLARLAFAMTTVDEYLTKNLPDTRCRYRLLCGHSAPALPTPWDTDARVERTTLTLHDPQALAAAVADTLADFAPDYLDVTGADPRLVYTAQHWADRAGVGIFSSGRTSLYNISGAEELTYGGPRRGLTVSEMFRLTGAQPQAIESDKYAGLERHIFDLYELAFGSEADQNTYKKLFSCLERGKERRENPTSDYFRDHILLLRPQDERLNRTVAVDVADPLYPVLLDGVRLMEQQDILQSCQITPPANGLPGRLTGQVNPRLASASELQAFLEQLDAGDPPEQLRLFGKYDPFARCERTYLEAATLELSARAEHIEYAPVQPTLEPRVCALLQKLQQRQLITHLNNTGTEATFRAANRTLRGHFTGKQGDLLEQYLYFLCLNNSRFDNVENGISYKHSALTGAPENELDIIATYRTPTGVSSLVITAKWVIRDNLTKENKLNYILYEALYQAEKFCLNPRVVLAAPLLPCFTNPSLSNLSGIEPNITAEMAKANQRGVYLLGKEFFQTGRVDRALELIANGDPEWYRCALPDYDEWLADKRALQKRIRDQQSRRTAEAAPKAAPLQVGGLQVGQRVTVADLRPTKNKKNKANRWGVIQQDDQSWDITVQFATPAEAAAATAPGQPITVTLTGHDPQSNRWIGQPERR